MPPGCKQSREKKNIVAAMCRMGIPRCGKCAGEHGIKGCVVSVDKVVWVNYRGAHVAVDQKCPVR